MGREGGERGGGEGREERRGEERGIVRGGRRQACGPVLVRFCFSFITIFFPVSRIFMVSLSPEKKMVQRLVLWCTCLL